MGYGEQRIRRRQEIWQRVRDMDGVFLPGRPTNTSSLKWKQRHLLAFSWSFGKSHRANRFNISFTRAL